MATVFSITTATTNLHTDAQGKGECSFTVSNTSGRRLRGRAEVRASNPSQQAWFSIAGEPERDYAVGGTDQVSVKIAAPTGAPAGKYSFRLDAVSAANPDEDFAEGPTVTVDVGPTTAKKPFPWWIVAAAAALIVVSLGLYFWLRPKPAPAQTASVVTPPPSDASTKPAPPPVEATPAPAVPKPVPVPAPVAPPRLPVLPPRGPQLLPQCLAQTVTLGNDYAFLYLDLPKTNVGVTLSWNDVGVYKYNFPRCYRVALSGLRYTCASGANGPFWQQFGSVTRDANCFNTGSDQQPMMRSAH